MVSQFQNPTVQQGLPVQQGSHDDHSHVGVGIAPLSAEDCEQQHMLQHQQQHHEPGFSPQSAEERELQYMQQQQQQPSFREKGTQQLPSGLPSEFQLPPAAQGNGNPFDAQTLPSGESSQLSHASVAGAQALGGDQHHQSQSTHHHEARPANLQQPQPGQSQHISQKHAAAGLFPRIDYDWAGPAPEQQGPSEKHQHAWGNGNLGALGSAGQSPVWPPPAFQGGAATNGVGPGSHHGPAGLPGPGVSGPYGPPGPMGSPGFNHYGPPPPPMYYPPGPPPIGEIVRC